jgi:hypothetical protein
MLTYTIVSTNKAAVQAVQSTRRSPHQTLPKSITEKINAVRTQGGPRIKVQWVRKALAFLLLLVRFDCSVDKSDCGEDNSDGVVAEDDGDGDAELRTRHCRSSLSLSLRAAHG